MKHTPCEYIVWNRLPIIRKGIALSMIKEYGLKQNETAEKLGVTPSAVSQYISGKRGNKKIFDKELRKEINISAKRIIQSGEEVLVLEICRICKIFTSKKLIPLDKKGYKHEIL